MSPFVRSLVPALAMIALLAPAPVGAAPPAAEAKLPEEARVVVALTTGDLDTFEKRVVKGLPALANTYREQGRRLVPVVVIHGEAYRFFLKDLTKTRYAGDAAVKARQAELRASLEKLAKEHGVRFEICAAGMKARQLDTANVYPFVHVVPNAVISLIDWQQRGYAFVPVG